MRKVVLAVVALAVLAIGSTALAGSADVNVTGTGFPRSGRRPER
jgi:hypothetical protein